MGTDRNTVRSREFGAMVRMMREGQGLTGHGLAQEMTWSDSTISRLERGDRLVSVPSLTSLLTVCGLRGNALLDCLARMSDHDNGYYLSPHGEEMTDSLLTLVIHEQTAKTIQEFEPAFVPGLLQTEAYCRVLFARHGATGERVETRVQIRRERQQIIDSRRRDRPNSTFYLHENALRSVVGDKMVMHEQIIKLLMLSSDSKIAIRILPVTEHAVASPSPIRLMTFSKFEPVGYAELVGASAFIEDPMAIAEYRAWLDLLDESSLSVIESREMLDSLERLYGEP